MSQRSKRNELTRQAAAPDQIVDPAADLAIANPILARGQFGVTSDTGLLKIGDGTTAWNDLPEFIVSIGGGGEDEPISGLPVAADIAAGDLFAVVDVSDTTDSADGTKKRATNAVVMAAEAVAERTMENKTITSFSNTVAADEMHVRCRNTSGVFMGIGTPVYLSGYNFIGTAAPTISPADASSAATMPCIGITGENIGDGEFGEVVIAGFLDSVNTSAFSNEDVLYVSETAGELTAVPPVQNGTNRLQPIAVVLYAAGGGKLQVLNYGEQDFGFGLNGTSIKGVGDLAAYSDGSGGWTLPTGLVVLSGTIDLGAGYLTVSDGTVLRGFADAVLTSTTTGGVVRTSGHTTDLVMREFSIVCATGPCVVLDGALTGQLNLFFLGLIGASAGTITGWQVQSIKQCYINAADGLTFDGTTSKVFVDSTPFYGVTGSAIRFAATLVTAVIDITTTFFKFDSPGVGIEAESGYTVGGGLVRGSLIAGTAVPLSGLSASDAEWRMTNNSGIADSRVTGVLSLDTSAATVISTAGVAVKVAGTTTAWSINERFDHSDNRLTYTGTEPATVNVDAQFAVDTGNNQTLSFYIAVNGSIVVESQSQVRVGSGGDERAGFLTGIFAMTTGDYIEVWAANEDSTSDLTVLSLTLKASS